MKKMLPALAAARLGIALALAAGAAACGGGDDLAGPAQSPTVHRAGWGDSTATPAGRPLHLPAGVTLAEPIVGFDYDCARGADAPVHVGRGGAVRVCLAFTNHNSGMVTLQLPAGLVFASHDPQVSNGVLVTPATVELAPGKTTVVGVHALCLNEARRPTRDTADRYTLGPVSDDAQLLALAAGAATTPGLGPLGVLDDGTLQKGLWRLAGSAPGEGR